MNLVLSPETQKLLEERMSKGGYQSPEDAVRAGLAYLGQHEQSGDFRAGELAEFLAVADAEIDRGELLDGESVFEEIRQLSKTHRQGRTAG
jgi:antitoxin ParD1/3/4